MRLAALKRQDPIADGAVAAMMLTRVPAVRTSVGSAGSVAGRAVSVRSVAWIVTDHRDAAALEQAARRA